MNGHEVETADDGHIRWLRFENGLGEAGTLAVVAPELEWPVVVGDGLVVEYEQDGGFAGGHLDLRSASESDLLVWIGTADSVDALNAPSELTLSQGDEVCRNRSRCVAVWTQHDLDLRLQGDAQVMSLGYGEVDTIGDFRVAHGGVVAQGALAQGCADVTFASASAAIWRSR